MSQGLTSVIPSFPAEHQQGLFFDVADFWVSVSRHLRRGVLGIAWNQAIAHFQRRKCGLLASWELSTSAAPGSQVAKGRPVRSSLSFGPAICLEHSGQRERLEARPRKSSTRCASPGASFGSPCSAVCVCVFLFWRVVLLGWLGGDAKEKPSFVCPPVLTQAVSGRQGSLC